MADDYLDFSDWIEFQEALKNSPGAFIPFAADAMETSVRLVQGGLAEYPPSTEANEPGRFSRTTGRPMGYYERGRGEWYPIMTKQTLEESAGGKFGKSRGVINASKFQKSISQVQGYKLIPGSEQLGKSWSTSVHVADVFVEGEVGNNASYADYVQGENQSALMAALGWESHSVDAVLEDVMPELDANWRDAADKFIKSLPGE